MLCRPSIPLLQSNLHPLLKTIFNSPLPGRLGLGKGGRSSKWTSRRVVPHTDDTNIVRSADGGIAGHARRHLDGQGEVSVGGKTESSDETGKILSDLGGLESVGVGAARCAIDDSFDGAGAVLVDLKWLELVLTLLFCEGEARAYLSHDQGDLSAVRASRQTALSTSTSRVTHDRLSRKLILRTTVATAETATTTKQPIKESRKLTLALIASLLNRGDIILYTNRVLRPIVGRSGADAHEILDHDGGINGAVALGAAEGTDFAALDLAITDDGGVGLGAAAVGAAVARSSVGDCS